MFSYKLKILFQNLLFGLFFIFFIFSFFCCSKLGVLLFFFPLFVVFIAIKEFRKYDRNNPYPKKKINKGFFQRVLTGILAAVHYLHFIFTYNHQKYNTQVDFPTTLECYVGNLWIIFLLLYGIISYKMISLGGFWYFVVPGILILTNLIDFIRYKFLIKKS